MSVLVTGGAGYIGSHMVLELLDAGEDVVVIDNLSTGFRWAVPPAARLVVGDIGDQELVRSTIRRSSVNAIIHFAGSIVVPESVRDPLGYYQNNTVKSRELIEAAVACNVPHFIFSSTAAVYGTPPANPISEDTPLAPISPYGTSKMMTEIMLRDVAAAHDLTYCALRYFNVAGADPKGRSGQSSQVATHLIKIASQAALGFRSHLDVFGTDYDTPDGTCVRDYIHVSDLCRAHRLALGNLRTGGTSKVMNCGYGRGFSVREVIDTIKRVTGEQFDVRDTARRDGDPASLIADNTRIRDALAWTPELDDLGAIIAQAYEWEKHLLRFRAAS
ncbi:MAG: UDP-glucose 4-epimerase GalE [Pseudomonadota bacterium]